MEVVYANLLKLMSAIFNRPGQCTYAATCAHSQPPPPSLLFCRESSFTPSVHPAFSWLRWNGCSLVASAAHLDVCLYTPSSFLASQPDPWASSRSQTLPFRSFAAALSTTRDPAIWLGLKGIGHPTIKVLSPFAHACVI